MTKTEYASLTPDQRDAFDVLHEQVSRWQMMDSSELSTWPTTCIVVFAEGSLSGFLRLLDELYTEGIADAKGMQRIIGRSAWNAVVKVARCGFCYHSTGDLPPVLS